MLRNVAGFDTAAGERLVLAMNRAFPFAEVEPDERHFEMLSVWSLPDEADRHVWAAALAAEASVLCTANTKHFPSKVIKSLDLEVFTPDQLLSRLVAECQTQMLAAHRTAVASLKGATDQSTIAALHRAGAPETAHMMADLLGIG